jgi:hypothetical protein
MLINDVNPSIYRKYFCLYISCKPKSIHAFATPTD